MKSAARLEDVARLAGVSTATVSRALSRPQRVRGATRDRIEAAVEKLAYVPDAAARALALGRTQTVGCIIPTLDHAIFARSTHALQTSLHAADYQLLVASHNYDPQLELKLALSLQQRGVDALVLVGTDHHKALWANLQQWGKPCVLTWSCDPRLPSVGFDNAAISFAAIRHLLDLGHRHIAMVSGYTQHNDRARMRIEGFHQAMAAAGLQTPAHWVVEQSLTIAGGRQGLAEIFGKTGLSSPTQTRRSRRSTGTPPPGTPHLPTAVLCGNDLLATGVLFEAQRMGLRVPQDISVCGIDNHELSAQVSPALTTIDLPTVELGRIAAAQVLAALAGEPIAQLSQLPFSLLVRGSTAAPAAVAA